jgi:hypothetical protein
MVTEQILRYLAEHPDAKDAVEGIHKYWLIGASIPAAVEEVQNGLNLLVQSGWVIVSQNSLTPRLYRLNKDRLNEIQTFLSRRKVREREELSH